MVGIFIKIYDACENRKWIVAGVLGIIFISSAWIVSTSLRPEENIAAMLPDDNSTVARDFQLLQKAPFARKVMIMIVVEDTKKVEKLPAVSMALEEALRERGPFTAVSGGVDGAVGMSIMSTFNTVNPVLFTEQDYGEIMKMIGKDAIKRKVSANMRQLMSPDGMMSKQQIMDDPLGLSSHSLEKLQFVQLVSNLELKNGRFISNDGLHALLVAETDIEMTDSKGGRKLLDDFDAIAGKNLPPGFSSKILSTHRYTVANAEMIQRDLSIILTITSLGLLAIFVAYMRCWRAIVIFIFPAAVIIIALAVLTVTQETVSGVTLGFGAVLMGISIDFALHLYFSTLEMGDRRKGLREVVSPGLVCALTTIAAFAVLQFSNLPGQRQLSVFSISGIVAAVGLAFLALPHVLPTDKDLPSGRGAVLLDSGKSISPRKVLIGWMVFALLCLPGIMKVQFDGNLRNLGAIPEELKAIEQEMATTWGDFRGRAMVFAEGDSLEDALRVNDEVFRFFDGRVEEGQLLSLGAVLPSQEAQLLRAERWADFLEGNLEKMVTDLVLSGWPEKATKNAAEVLTRMPKLMTEKELRELGLNDLFNSMIVEREGKTLIITMVPDDPSLAQAFENEAISSAYFVSQGNTGAAVGNAIAKDFRRFITYAMIIIVALVAVLYRRPRLIFAALAPVFSGILGLFAFMGYSGVAMNMFNVIASILLIGLGVDYGIFMVHKVRTGAGRATVLAVWVSALTTMAGFGALVFGRHPALFSIGVTVSVGILFSIATALFVVPALVPRGEPRKGEQL